MAASTLSGYYTGQGQALPSLGDRANTFQQLGLGSAGTYIGSAAQNNALLGKLQGGSGLPVGTTISGNNPAPAPTTMQGYMSANYNPVADAMKALVNKESSLADPSQRLAQLTQQSGVTDAQAALQAIVKQLTATQQQSQDLEGNINTRTKDFGLNEAQRQRLLAYEGKPINDSISKLSNAQMVANTTLTADQQNLANLLTAANQGDTNAIAALKDSLTNAQNTYQTGATSFSNDLTNKANAASSRASAASKAPTTQEITADLNTNIQKGISDMVGAMKNKTYQPWSTEALISQLQQLYPELPPKTISDNVYSARKPLESQYTF